MDENTELTTEPQTMYGFCPWCGHEIEPSEPCVAVWLQVERQDPEATAIPTVDVLDSEGVIALCRDCGSALEEKTLRLVIHEHYQRGLLLTDLTMAALYMPVVFSGETQEGTSYHFGSAGLLLIRWLVLCSANCTVQGIIGMKHGDYGGGFGVRVAVEQDHTLRA